MIILLMLVILVWLIVLQVTVNRLQDKLDQLPLMMPKQTQEKNPVPPASSVSKPQAVISTKKAEVVSAPASQHIAPEPEPFIFTEVTEKPSAKKSAKPNFEITTAKLFSWLGGFMLFLGVVFGIKYAVENHFLLLSPAMRIWVSSLLGVCLAGCGYMLKNEKYRITSHTLLGSGWAIVYAAVFCAHTFYHLISLPLCFVFMGLVSFAALGTSLVKNAKYVGYLGAIIAFLTPILLHNGSDAWVAFFLYVFCINLTSAYGAVKKGWYGLFICTLTFTWLSQAAWLFPVEAYKLTGVAIFFSLYALASAWLVRRQPACNTISYAAGIYLCMGLLLMLPAGACLPGVMPVVLPFLGYTLLANALVLLLAERQLLPYGFTRACKVLSFAVLGTWMMHTQAPLWLTLCTCLVFTLLNSCVELLPRFKRTQPDVFSAIYPVAMMGGILILSLIQGTSTSVNDFVGLFGVLSLLTVLILAVAAWARKLWLGLIATALLFIFLLGQLILETGTEAFAPFLLLGGMLPVILCVAVLQGLRRVHLLPENDVLQQSIAAVTALLPFLLILTAAIQANETTSLHWILGTTALVYAVNIIVARFYQNTYILPVAVVGSTWVQLAAWCTLVLPKWPYSALAFAGWSIVLLGLCIYTPFISRKKLWNKNGPWIACALSGLTACLFGCLWVGEYAPDTETSIIPVLLLVIYARLLHKLWGDTKEPQGPAVAIGFMSGAVLIFLTIIFPLALQNHWLAVAWAAEAVLLLALHTKIPYTGWKIGAGLVFVPVVCMLLFFPYTHIATGRIWNWYLWVYGLCAMSFFMCAKLWDTPRFFKSVFYIAGAATLFWLLNMEIAHWFNTERKYLYFEFTGQVAEALAYTLGWALFGLAAIGVGLKLQKSAVSKAGIGVVGLALAKFFLSDIWQLQAIYRIIGLFGLAVMLIVASFWYQRKKVIR